MLKTMTAALIAASLIAGPALAQGNTNAGAPAANATVKTDAKVDAKVGTKADSKAAVKADAKGATATKTTAKPAKKHTAKHVKHGIKHVTHKSATKHVATSSAKPASSGYLRVN